MRKVVFGVAWLVGGSVLATAAMATQLVYTPVNPTFGGNPLNGSFLLQSGQAQGHGASGSSPNLSGLDNALSNLGSGLSNPIIINLPSPSVPSNP